MIDFVTIFSLGRETLGILFPLLYVLALCLFNAITWDLIGGTKLMCVNRKALQDAISFFCWALATVGYLQTLLSLCNVGFSLTRGNLSVGIQTFSIMVTAFSSTLFGGIGAFTGKFYLYIIKSAERLGFVKG